MCLNFIKLCKSVCILIMQGSRAFEYPCIISSLLIEKICVVIVPAEKEMKRIKQSNGPLSCGLRCGHTCLLLFSGSPRLPETDAIRPFPPGPGFSTVRVQGYKQTPPHYSELPRSSSNRRALCRRRALSIRTLI